MVVLYVAGKRLGTWAESEHLFAQAVNSVPIEFRDESGAVIHRTTPPAEPLCPWDPTLTVEESDRMSAAGGGVPLAEFWKRMGVE